MPGSTYITPPCTRVTVLRLISGMPTSPTGGNTGSVRGSVRANLRVEAVMWSASPSSG